MKYMLEEPVHGQIGKEHYQCTITWRNGSFISDEPIPSGGTDLGPDPYSLLLSSLASCTIITLRMYIDRKQWDIPQISVNTNLFQNLKDGKTITTIDRDIQFHQQLPNEQLQRLLDIANACPISKILQGDIAVRTYLYDEKPVEKQLKYTNGEITVVWKPEVCKHSGRCVLQQPQVFNLKERPWVNMQGASTAAIVKQVNQCPTGALSYFKNGEEKEVLKAE